ISGDHGGTGGAPPGPAGAAPPAFGGRAVLAPPPENRSEHSLRPSPQERDEGLLFALRGASIAVSSGTRRGAVRGRHRGGHPTPRPRTGVAHEAQANIEPSGSVSATAWSAGCPVRQAGAHGRNAGGSSAGRRSRADLHAVPRDGRSHPATPVRS